MNAPRQPQMIFRRPALPWTFGVAATLLLASNLAHPQPTNGTPEAIDLPTALRLAGAQNLDVQVARERLKEAEANRTRALEQFFPWIAPGVVYHRRDGVAQAVPAGTISDAHFQSYSPGAVLAAQVNLGDAIYNSLAAKQHVTASDKALDSQRQDSILGAARGYFELARSKALVEVSRRALQTSQDYEQQLHQAVATGIAFKGDELRVRTQTQSYQVALRQTLEQQRVAAADLARHLHLDSRVELVPQGGELVPVTLLETNIPLSTLVEQALTFRPELKQSQALVLAARAEKNGAVYGPLIPSVGAQAYGGGLGGGPDHGPSNFGAVGDYTVGVSWRLGPGGLFDSGRIRSSQSRLTASVFSHAKLKDTITAEVVTSLDRVRSLADQIALAEQKLASATETLRLARERKQYGVGVVLEDIQAQQDLTRARSDYVTTIAEYNKAQYALTRALGALSAP